MFTLHFNLTGKQAVRIIDSAIKKRSKQVGVTLTREDFCEVSGLHRNSIWRYSKGQAPAHEGIIKIYSGLLSWQLDVELQPK